MHLVGPRAEWVKLSDEYNKMIVNYSFRHVVKSGITGWAQLHIHMVLMLMMQNKS